MKLTSKLSEQGSGLSTSPRPPDRTYRKELIPFSPHSNSYFFLLQQLFLSIKDYAAAAAAAKSLQSCPTLCNPIDGSPPGSPVLGILQARTLEWVAISFSNACK